MSASINAGDFVWKQLSTNAPWIPRDSAGEVVFDGKMWILGGWTIDENGSFQRLNDIWHTIDGTAWNKVTDAAPWPVRNLCGSVVFNNRIWILGGCDGKQSLNDIWYSSDGKAWLQSNVTVPWSPRIAFGCVVFDNKIWVVGGFDFKTTKHTNDVWCSEDGLNWKQVTPHALWSPRAMFPLIVFDSKMWLFGGGVYHEKSTNYHDIWYSVDGCDWHLATEDAGWTERRFHIITVFQGECWLLGGVTDGNVNLNDIWRSGDCVNWQIEEKAAPWRVRHEQMCLVYGDKLWMFGGFSGDAPSELVYGEIWTLERK